MRVASALASSRAGDDELHGAIGGFARTRTRLAHDPSGHIHNAEGPAPDLLVWKP